MAELKSPRCPNHGCGLVDTDYKAGIGICPVSHCRFTFDADWFEKTKKLKIDAFGNHQYEGDWKVASTEGEEK